MVRLLRCGKRASVVFVAAVLLAGWSHPANLFAASTVTYVQGNYATPQTPQTSVTVPYSGKQTAGDLNVVVVGWNDTTATVNSVADNSGNLYIRAVGPTTVSGALSQSIYYAKNIASAAAGANSVTVTFSAAAVYPDIRILEYSNADRNLPVDVTATGIGSSATSSSAVATTTNSVDLIFGANIAVTGTTAAGSGFTKRLLTSPNGDIAEDQDGDKDGKLQRHRTAQFVRRVDHADGSLPHTLSKLRAADGDQRNAEPRLDSRRNIGEDYRNEFWVGS